MQKMCHNQTDNFIICTYFLMCICVFTYVYISVYYRSHCVSHCMRVLESIFSCFTPVLFLYLLEYLPILCTVFVHLQPSLNLYLPVGDYIFECIDTIFAQN